MKKLFDSRVRRILHSSFFILPLLLVSCGTRPSLPEKTASINVATEKKSIVTPLEWSVRLADSEIARRGDSLAWKPEGKAKWDYTAGLFTVSLLKLNEKIPSPAYLEFTTKSVLSFITEDGQIQTYKPAEFQLDALNAGKTLLAMNRVTKSLASEKAAWLLRRQLDTQPRTFDGGFWHKERYTNQMWLDGIFMAAPFYAECAVLFAEPQSAFDDIATQIRLMDEHSFDAKTGLNYHGWDAAKIQPWANPETGSSSNFWGRAMGWYAMALVDTLDYFPTNHPARPQIIATFQKLCAGVVKYQDAKTGLWYQVMDQGARPGNYLEATASAMFVYAMAKGVNRGHLPQTYMAGAVKGFDGIVKNLIADDGNGRWSLTKCCSVAGLGFKNAAGIPRDGSFDYYVSEPVVNNDLKGVGPFILAGIELQNFSEAK